ncbi:hypothetical protein GCM10017083_00460 [Thalassobaculum fulvum]|uniref:Uncharacterized protein n=1 Tax=Thalassobaculum fulvum TaxID=1633335 RepID=A0A919CNK8_9PROT|nr:hypothetical protein [Thalassobaculum fulvum]GHD39041.1 hypothetical protein GCM10017083_00460 [Thalassobaculum fulvum]
MDRITISVGDPVSTLEARLGPPDEARTLKNDAPATMGAAVVEYAFKDDVATLAAGGTAIPARAVQFVLDGNGKVLRILANPNAFSRSTPRLQRGTPVLADSATLPTDPALRAAPR